MHFLSLASMSIVLLCIAHTTHTAESKAGQPKKKAAYSVTTIQQILQLQLNTLASNPQDFIASHSCIRSHIPDIIAVQLLARHQDWTLPWAQEILQSGTLSSENAAKLLEHHAKTEIIIKAAHQEGSVTKK